MSDAEDGGTLTGRVVSNKMDKTITVRSSARQAPAVRQVHPPLDQAARARREERVQEGDLVPSSECRPMSHKTWKLVRVVETRARRNEHGRPDHDPAQSYLSPPTTAARAR